MIWAWGEEEGTGAAGRPQDREALPGVQKPVVRGAGPAPPTPSSAGGSSSSLAASGGNRSWAHRVLCAPGKGAATAPPDPAGLPPSSGISESLDSPNIHLGRAGRCQQPSAGLLWLSGQGKAMGPAAHARRSPVRSGAEWLAPSRNPGKCCCVSQGFTHATEGL